MGNISLRTVALTLLSLSGAASSITAPAFAQAGFTTQDTQLLSDGSSLSAAAATGRSGFTAGPPAGGIVLVYVYRLPTLNYAAGQRITDASLTFSFTGATTAGGVVYNTDLYGLAYETSVSLGLSKFFIGTNDPSAAATKIQDNYLTQFTPSPFTTPAVGPISTSTAANTNLISFLNTQYANGAVGGNFVYFRLNPDVTSAANNGGANFATQDNTTVSLRPTLAFTIGSVSVVPEPSALFLAASGLVTLTVGGAIRRSYRWRSRGIG